MSIDSPGGEPANIMTGKSYEIPPGSEGLRLSENAQPFYSLVAPSGDDESRESFEGRCGKENAIRPRPGKGGFRIMVRDEYSHRCAITGEETLPALETAHIQLYAANGPHKVSNGILMRSDLHPLFDNGYCTLTKEFHVEVR